MSAKSTKRGATGLRKAAAVAQLRSERELRAIIDTVLRLAKARGIPETEVHVEEVIDALTRFANNAIHQHVAEHGVVVSIRTVAKRPNRSRDHQPSGRRRVSLRLG